MNLEEQKLIELERKLCIEDPMYFRQRVFGYTKIGKDFHFDLDAMLNKKGRYKVITIPRNHYKTTQVLSWIGHKILVNPNLSILYETSAGLDAKRSILEMRGVFEGPKFKELFGDWRGQPWEDWQFTVNKRTKFQAAPTISASGLDKAQTGQHYDIIILDDLVDEHNHKTHEGRESAKDRLRDAMSLLRPGGLLIVIGTPWDPDDLYAWIRNTPEIMHIFDSMLLDVYRKDGTLLLPDEFCETAEEEILTGKRSLEMLRIILGPLKFASQYRCDIGSVDLSEFHSGWLLHAPDADVRRRLFDRSSRGRVILFCDPAMGKEKSLRPCDTAIVGAHFMPNHSIDVFLIEAGLIDPGATIERLLHHADDYHADEVHIEDVGFQGTMITQLEYQRDLRHLHRFEVRPANPRGEGDKERRIRSLFPYYRFGQVRHAESLRGGILEEQLKRFPKGTKRDVIDALSQFCYNVDFPPRPPLRQGAVTSGIGASTMLWSQRAPKQKVKKKLPISSLGKDFLDIG